MRCQANSPMRMTLQPRFHNALKIRFHHGFRPLLGIVVYAKYHGALLSFVRIFIYNLLKFYQNQYSFRRPYRPESAQLSHTPGSLTLSRST